MSQHAIPLAETADLARFARRTTVVRVVLLVAILAAIGFCIYESSTLHVGEATLLGPGTSGVVVLDLSSSTDSAPPREIPGVLRHLANAGGRSGLVLFSDVAYEALPLGATSEELRPFLRYFRRPALPPQPVAGANGRFTRPPQITRRATPWSRSFRSGTRISAGLESARRMVLAGAVAREATSCSSATSTTRCSTSPPSSRRCDATSATGSTSASWRSARPSRTAASS